MRWKGSLGSNMSPENSPHSNQSGMRTGFEAQDFKIKTSVSAPKIINFLTTKEKQTNKQTTKQNPG